MVYTSGNGVDVFTYDQTIGDFLLTHEKVRMPHKGKIYSVNEGYYLRWSAGLKRYIDYLKENHAETSRPYTLRYIGTAVADIHRTLIYGGIFMYPADSHNPHGKLRLLYELNPLAMIIEQAGGRATDGYNRILDIIPTHIHQRSPVFMGSLGDVLEVEYYLSQK